MCVLLHLGANSNNGATATITTNVDAQTGGTTSVAAHMPAVSGGMTSVATPMPVVNAQTGGASESKPTPWRPWLDASITATTLGKE